ncbi:FixJ family two-component response regulator [Paraburkholderia sp. GAS333]|uniref:response regulator transcription factor n=1 Tax=Paraburkholderia sp. GAS333 TaxID=3156279 RepID=UPI003D1A4399
MVGFSAPTHLLGNIQWNPPRRAEIGVRSLERCFRHWVSGTIVALKTQSFLESVMPVPSELEPLVYVIDDEEMVRHALVRLLRSAGFNARSFASPAEVWSQDWPNVPMCILLDMNLKTTNGFDVQSQLAQKGVEVPVVFLTGYGSIPMSVRAIKAGAHEFLTKPVDDEDLIEAVRRALAQDEANLTERAFNADVLQRAASLTPREMDVFELAAKGRMIKHMAHELGTQDVTVKVHKGRVMSKMGAKTLIDLAQMWEVIRRTR